MSGAGKEAQGEKEKKMVRNWGLETEAWFDGLRCSSRISAAVAGTGCSDAVDSGCRGRVTSGSSSSVRVRLTLRARSRLLWGERLDFGREVLECRDDLACECLPFHCRSLVIVVGGFVGLGEICLH